MLLEDRENCVAFICAQDAFLIDFGHAFFQALRDLLQFLEVDLGEGAEKHSRNVKLHITILVPVLPLLKEEIDVLVGEDLGAAKESKVFIDDGL